MNAIPHDMYGREISEGDVVALGKAAAAWGLEGLPLTGTVTRVDPATAECGMEVTISFTTKVYVGCKQTAIVKSGPGPATSSA